MKSCTTRNRGRLSLMGTLTVLSILGVARNAEAQIIFGNAGNFESPLYVLDLDSGTTSLFATPEANVAGVAVNDPGRTIYWFDSNGFLSAYDYDGTLTPIGDLSPLQAQGVLAGGMAYDSSQDSLFVTADGFDRTTLFQVDPLTGDSTLLGDLTVNGELARIGGLGFDNSTGKLYGVNDGDIARGLVEIDPVGLTVDLISPYPDGLTDVDGLTIGGGNAYLMLDRNRSNGSDVFEIDLATGDLVREFEAGYLQGGSLSGAGWAPGLTAIPEPGSAAMIGAALLGLIWRRRRRTV